MSLKDVLASAAKSLVSYVTPAPRSYLLVENEDGGRIYQPMEALYTPANPPPQIVEARSHAERAAGMTP